MRKKLIGLIPFLLNGVVNGVLLLLDIAILFIGIRMLCYRRRVRVLTAFDAAGAPLVTRVMAQVDRGWSRICRSRQLSEPQTLAIGLTVLLLARFILAGMWAAVT